MPRRARSIVGGYAYHVLNRANGRLRLFKKDADFAAFEQVLVEALARVPLRILGYTFAAADLNSELIGPYPGFVTTLDHSVTKPLSGSFAMMEGYRT